MNPPQPSSKSAALWSYPGQKCLSHQSKRFNACSAKLCKALYFTASTSSGTVHPSGFSWRDPIPTWRRAGGNCFLRECKDTLPALTPMTSSSSSVYSQAFWEEKHVTVLLMSALSPSPPVGLFPGVVHSLQQRKDFWTTLWKSSSTLSKEILQWHNTKKQKALWASKSEEYSLAWADVSMEGRDQMK